MNDVWILRVRTRCDEAQTHNAMSFDNITYNWDGTERVQVPVSGCLHDLRLAISSKLQIEPDDQHISLDKDVLTVQDELVVTHPKMLRDDARMLTDFGIRHGDILYLRYLKTVREPTPTLSHSMRKFSGGKMTVNDLVAKQIRMVRQERPHVPSISFDKHSANIFQQYVNHTLGFHVPRCGILYGRNDEDGNIYVDFIYEPPQDADDGKLILMRNELEEHRVGSIANALGMQKFGWIVAQPEVQTHPNSEKDNRGNSKKEGSSAVKKSDSGKDQGTPESTTTITFDNIEIAARMQGEVGNNFVTALVKLCSAPDGSKYVHFEAFQCSDQCVKLFKEEKVRGVGSHQGLTRMIQEVWVGNKEDCEVDNDFFLVPVKILDHTGPLRSDFPIENRLVLQTRDDLKDHLKKRCRGRTGKFVSGLADFHLILFLSKHLDLNSDIALIIDAITKDKEIQDGYKLIIESIAGL